MVIALIGESCTGKSTVAACLKERLNARVFTGNDYLKRAKSEPEARRIFMDELEAFQRSGEKAVYVISEKEQLSMLPENAVRALFTAELSAIKERFAHRTRGNLPAPIDAMLTRKHGMFDDVPHDLHFAAERDTLDGICDAIAAACG